MLSPLPIPFGADIQGSSLIQMDTYGKLLGEHLNSMSMDHCKSPDRLCKCLSRYSGLRVTFKLSPPEIAFALQNIALTGSKKQPYFLTLEDLGFTVCDLSHMICNYRESQWNRAKRAV